LTTAVAVTEVLALSRSTRLTMTAAVIGLTGGAEESGRASLTFPEFVDRVMKPYLPVFITGMSTS
jgi:hypothetical protein